MAAAFAEYIALNYRSHVELIWDYPRASAARAKFIPDEDDPLLAVTVSFEQRETEGPWYASFDVAGLAKAHRAFDIFNGVMQAIEEFLAVRQPQSLVIAAKEPQLGRIYETYLRREAATVEELGYRLASAERVKPFSEFRLERLKPSEWKHQ